MIIVRENPVSFIPIIITLESVNEALMLGEALRVYQNERKERGFISGGETPKDKIAEELLFSITQMGY